MPDIELARGWTVGLVRKCLEDQDAKNDLVDFVRARYTERFFSPIRELKSATGDEHRYGFAIMALCCLLIETLQCYRDGLPSTYRKDLEDLKEQIDNDTLVVDPKYKINYKKWSSLAGGPDTFKRFFDNDQAFFGTRLNAREFYQNVRCGLLHQAQTKAGWLLKRSGPLWQEAPPCINRDIFSQKLQESFDEYLAGLAEQPWDDDLWKMARQKIYWLATLSEP